jgi:uncharacterized protein (TIGR03000 family)
MGRVKVSLGLLALSATLVVFSGTAEVGAYGRCWGPYAMPCGPYYGPCMPCVIQYVIVYQNVGGGGGGGGGPVTRPPDSRKVNFLFLLDTEDDDIGPEVLREYAQVQSTLYNKLPTKYRGDIADVRGQDLQRGKVLRALEGLAVGPNETLVVYCNLHGSEKSEKKVEPKQDGDKKDADKKDADKKDGDKKGEAKEEAPAPAAEAAPGEEGKKGEQVLNMWKKAPEGERTLLRAELVEAIRKKNARLSLLITDSCFGLPQEDFDTAEGVKVRLASGAPEPPAGFKPRDPNDLAPVVLEDLLINHEGLLNINSAKPEQFALAQTFSNTLVELANGWPKGAPVEWKNFFEQLQQDVEQRFKANVSDAAKVPPTSQTAQLFKKNNQTTQTPYNFEEEQKEPFPVYKQRADGTPGGPGTKEPGETSPAPGSPGETAAPAPAPATIAVNLPREALLFVDDVPVRHTATARRLLQTPELPPGKTFHYNLRAEMTVDGEKRVERRRVAVEAGKEAAVTFEKLRQPATVVGSAPAEVSVRLPADAQLYVDDRPSPGEGDRRTIRTAPLLGDRDYVMELKLRQTRDGKEETQTRRVELRAGQKVVVDFVTPDVAAAR